VKIACSLFWEEILDEMDPDHDGKIDKSKLREIVRELEVRLLCSRNYLCIQNIVSILQYALYCILHDLECPCHFRQVNEGVQNQKDVYIYNIQKYVRPVISLPDPSAAKLSGQRTFSEHTDTVHTAESNFEESRQFLIRYVML